MTTTSYAIALGSNRRHGHHGSPAGVVAAAAAELARLGRVVTLSPILSTPALGPAGRSFANAAAILVSPLDPPALLAELKRLERAFGRRRGRRWGPRVLDLDIILWSGGRWQQQGLIIPHPQMAARAFVLHPLAAIAPDWRLPGSPLAVRHLAARLDRPQPVDRNAHPF